jgi:hypothetical protein
MEHQKKPQTRCKAIKEMQDSGIGQHLDGKTLCSSDFLHATQPQKGLEHNSCELKSSSQADPAGDAERFPAGGRGGRTGPGGLGTNHREVERPSVRVNVKGIHRHSPGAPRDPVELMSIT